MKSNKFARKLTQEKQKRNLPKRRDLLLEQKKLFLWSRLYHQSYVLHIIRSVVQEDHKNCQVLYLVKKHVSFFVLLTSYKDKVRRVSSNFA